MFFVSKTLHCPAKSASILIKNIAARGRIRTLTLHGENIRGIIRVRRSFFPCFILAQEETFPFVSGMKIKQNFFNASFEITLTPNESCDVRIT